MVETSRRLGHLEKDRKRESAQDCALMRRKGGDAASRRLLVYTQIYIHLIENIYEYCSPRKNKKEGATEIQIIIKKKIARVRSN